jgi:hypothetical protein
MHDPKSLVLELHSFSSPLRFPSTPPIYSKTSPTQEKAEIKFIVSKPDKQINGPAYPKCFTFTEKFTLCKITETELFYVTLNDLAMDGPGICPALGV